jgi:hypothetical protein
LAKAGLALLNRTSAGKKNCKKKMLTKDKEVTKEALAKVRDPESEAKEAKEGTEVTDNLMKAGFQVDLEKAKQAQKIAKGTMTAAKGMMFAFYSNLLSPESNYSWNKIVSKQTESGVGYCSRYYEAWSTSVVGRLDMYRTKVLLYRTMVLLVRPTKVRR